MRVLIEGCCGLDVHRSVIVACLLTGRAGGKVNREIRSFSTTTVGLFELRDWLLAAACTHVGMESTGVYWRAIHALLEEAFTVVVGNAQRIKNVPGRKTDAKDCEWLADLLRHGLIPPSFVPPRPLRGLRDLLRFRRSQVDAQTNCRNRVLQVLEIANIKLAGVASDVFGVSGMAMVRALIAGTQTPAEIANLAKGRLRRKLPQLELALAGSVTDDHRFMLTQLLDELDGTARRIAAVEARVDEALAPYRTDHELLTTIPGVDWAGAAVMIAEHGVDMTVFGSAERLAAWAGVAPGNNESAGKHRRAGARKGNRHLKTALHLAALSAKATRGTYLRDKYYRLKARCGPARAVGAIAHKIVIAAFHILSSGNPYRDLGADYLDQRAQHRAKQHLVHRLTQMGYHVTLDPIAA